MDIKTFVFSACCALAVLHPADGTLLATKSLATAAVAVVKKPFVALGLAAPPPPPPPPPCDLEHGTRPATVYEIPAPTAQHTYGPPSQAPVSEGSLFSQQWVVRRPVQTYGTPAQSYRTPAQSYGPPAQTYGPPPQIYGPPVQSYGPPPQIYRPPAQIYGPPAQSYGPPPQSYRTPAQTYGPPAQSYIPPVQSNSQPARTPQLHYSGNPQLRLQRPPSPAGNLASLWKATQQAVSIQTNRVRDRLQSLNPISYIRGGTGNSARPQPQLAQEQQAQQPAQVTYKYVPDVGFTHYNEIHYYPVKIIETPVRGESKPSVELSTPTEDLKPLSLPAQEPYTEYRPANAFNTPKETYAVTSSNNGAQFTANEQQALPAKEYEAPAEDYTAPEKVFSVPIQVYEAQANEYSAPVKENSAPANEYATPSKEYSVPTQTLEIKSPSPPSQDLSVPAQYEDYPPSQEASQQYNAADKYNGLEANEILPPYSYKLVKSKVF